LKEYAQDTILSHLYFHRVSVGGEYFCLNSSFLVLDQQLVRLSSYRAGWLSITLRIRIREDTGLKLCPEAHLFPKQRSKAIHLFSKQRHKATHLFPTAITLTLAAGTAVE
jgi:hypothetical protein